MSSAFGLDISKFYFKLLILSVIFIDNERTLNIIRLVGSLHSHSKDWYFIILI